MAPFHGTRNKAIVREQWDTPLLTEWVAYLGHSISYLGLPGPKILDLRTWSPYLSYCSGVERLRKSGTKREEDLEIHRQILHQVALRGMDDLFQLLRGDIEDIIINGLDIDGQRPAMSSISRFGLAFQYSLINLDFLGGIGIRNKHGESRRVRAMKLLLERQRKTNFLLLLTLNVRDNLDDELTTYLNGAQRDATTSQVRDTLDWYAACGEGMRDYKLKGMVPLFMRREAEVHEFECIAYPPISYEGDGDARMVHFVFRLIYHPTNFHVFGTQTDEEVINFPMLTVTNETLCVADRQHPGFDATKYRAYLSLLPTVLQKHLISWDQPAMVEAAL